MRFGSYEGLETIASTLPVFGWMATTAPRWLPSASYAAFCTFGSIVSCTEAPFGSCPVTMFCRRSSTWSDEVPASWAFSAPSMPVGAPIGL